MQQVYQCTVILTLLILGVRKLKIPFLYMSLNHRIDINKYLSNPTRIILNRSCVNILQSMTVCFTNRHRLTIPRDLRIFQ